MKTYLGIDGGGTKTTSCLLADDTVITAHEGGPTNYLAVGFDQAYQNLKSLIEQTTTNQQIDALFVFVALSGIDTQQDKTRWRDRFNADNYLSQYHTNSVEFANDAMAALRSGTTEKNSIVLISGTGSSCYGTNSEGETVKAGGMNQILSDEGGGFDLGVKTLKHVTQTLDGRSDMGPLTDLFLNAHGISNIEELHDLVYLGKDGEPWGKPEIASVLPVLEKAVQEGDPWAKGACLTAVEDLMCMVQAVVARLKLNDISFDLVLAGSVLKHMPPVAEPLRLKLKETYSNCTIKEPQIPYAQAAALLAKEHSQLRHSGAPTSRRGDRI